MSIAAAILAGGKASRLAGIAKGMLCDAEDLPLIQRLVREFLQSGIHEVVLSVNNNPHAYARFERPLIVDGHSNAGPLGGIEAILSYFRDSHDSVFFSPCDVPSFSAKEMIELAEPHRRHPDRIVMAATIEGEHPLCAIVPVSALPTISRAIREGRYGVGRLWHELGANVVMLENAQSLVNINTTEDLDRWRRSIAAAPNK